MKMNKLCKKMERNKLDKGNVYDENYQKENEAEEEESEEKEKVDKKYNSKKCVVRNWPSEKLKQDENLQAFLEKRERGELLVQKTARIFEKFLAPAQLSSSTSTYVSFDQAIQLIACGDMPKMHSSVVGWPMTPSVVVNEPNINSCQEIDQHCEISCAHSPTTKPTARNTFIIRRPSIRKHRRHRRCNSSTQNVDDDSGSVNSQYLKYGQDFMLECYDSKQKPLMLFSSPQSPFGGAATSASSAQCDYVFKVHGEMKQSVGLALQKERHFNDQHSKLFYDDDTTIPSNFFHWKMFHINPQIRYETIGENIPINAKVIVQHGFSKQNLCCEKTLFSTIFGMEFGVSCHTEKNIYGVETESNIWQISTKSSES